KDMLSATFTTLPPVTDDQIGTLPINSLPSRPLTLTGFTHFPSPPLFRPSPILTITAAPLTASIANQNKVYGQVDPTLSSINVILGGVIANNDLYNRNREYSVNDAHSTSLTALTRVTGENIGTRAISSPTF